MRKLLLESLLQAPLSEAPPSPDDAALSALARSLERASRRRLGRSLSIRQVDAGSCNGCELEIHALNNALYDLERFGLKFVASPRHADGIVLSGTTTRNMEQALAATCEAVPGPKLVILFGACAISGGLYQSSDQLARKYLERLKIDLYIPGCPPHPLTFIYGLLTYLRKTQAGSKAGNP